MKNYHRFLNSLCRFFLFFCLIGTVVTVSFLLFLSSMELDVELVRKNAVITFLNIFLLSFILSIIDLIRRKLTVESPVERITKSLKKITKGDFNEKINRVAAPFESQFNPIIDGINALTAELSGVETLRMDFIADVSHEIKTPLAVIQNYATMLQNSALPESERVRYAKSISDASLKLSDLITNILRLNKLENQQIFSYISKFNLGEQLCECLLNFENILDKKELQVSTDIADGVFIESDFELLTLVWNNLFSNAVKFTENGGSIAVSMYLEGDCCIVKVADTGCGISKETGRHIFDKFYQGDTSRSSQGNGLGLSLVKRVIDIVGGEISVESEVGKGSTFTVKLRSGLNEKSETAF